jgi:uncharacterized membrane protein
MYHRLVGWHAPALRRTAVMAGVGVIVAAVLAWFIPWQLAVTGGWDAAALAFLWAVWPIIFRPDGERTRQVATREDETRGAAVALVVGASVVSLLGVGFALAFAGRASGTAQILLIALAVLTMTFSWTVVNTVFTQRYAHLHYSTEGGGIDFGDPAGLPPAYRDFAYTAFTIGMTYQVSDTALRSPRMRQTVLVHAMVSYVFGVVIVAGAINLIAGLIR